MSSTLTWALVVLELVLTVDAFTDWSYRKPSGERYNWVESYPECGGHHQSPIDLDKVTTTSERLRFNWTGGYMLGRVPITVTNDGNTVVVTSESEDPPRLIFDNGKVYQLDNVHFYWGNGDGEGSEHTVKGKRFALEMQAVHNRVDASGVIVSPAETVIIVSLFKYSSTGSNEYSLDHLMDPDESVEGIEKAGTSMKNEAYDLLNLVYILESNYFWYNGSLTTPPCSEGVTFIVANRIRMVDKSQLTYFRELRGKDNKTMGENFRSIQKRNGRKIYFFPSPFTKYRGRLP